jgi:hypothetical protein
MYGSTLKERANAYRQSHAQMRASTYLAFNPHEALCVSSHIVVAIPTRDQGQGRTGHEWLERRNPSKFELRATGAKAGWAP